MAWRILSILAVKKREYSPTPGEHDRGGYNFTVHQAFVTRTERMAGLMMGNVEAGYTGSDRWGIRGVSGSYMRPS